MQVIKENIKRPRLFEPFFNEELTPSNEFVTYIDCTPDSPKGVNKKNVTPSSHNIKKSLKSKNIDSSQKSLEKKLLPDYSGNFYTFLVDTVNETHIFHTEVQAVKYCVKNELFKDIQFFYKYEWSDYHNDIVDDIPEPIEIFNVQDSVHFNWVLADFERTSATT